MGVATFNWSIKGGSFVQKDSAGVGFTIAASADDVKPSNAAYFAMWGDDVKGNGSRKYPWRTIAKATNAINVLVFGSGVYRGAAGTATGFTIGNGNIAVGDGNVTFDGYATTSFNINATGGNGYLRNVKLRNLTLSTNWTLGCDVQNCAVNSNNGHIGSLFVNCNIPANQNAIHIGCTFVRCYTAISDSALSRVQKNIYYQCNLDILNPTVATVIPVIDFHVFYQCNFRIVTTAAASASMVMYPTIPSGYAQYATTAALRAAMNAIYTASPGMIPNCTVGDPKFNNITIGDYTLAFDSPAKNRSYNGTYVGAFSIASSLRIRSDAALSAMDNASAVNLTLADDSATLVDTSIIASIVSKPIANTAGREIYRLPTFGINADRNGEVIDTTSDLDAAATIAAGTTLSAATPYLVEVGSITYNTNVYQPGERFTALATPGTFTTAASGVVREIIEAPTRENVEVRVSEGGSGYTSSGSIVSGNWYFVENASVTYDGATYAAGTFIKGTATTTFTGSGNLRLAFASETYFYYEINQKPYSNNTGNVRSGAIVQGNGHKDFDRTAANMFALSQKFIQIKYTIQVNNLRP